MTRKITTLSLALALTTLTTGIATAAACGERTRIVAILELSHGEALAGRGIQSDENLYEIWMSKDSGSWTILRTDANGTSCVMAAGTHWLPEDPAPGGVPG